MNTNHSSSPASLKARTRALLRHLSAVTDTAQAGGPHDEARRLAETLCRDQPTDPEAWSLLAAVWERLGQPERALQCGERALTLQPDYPEAHVTVGNSLFALGRLEPAEMSYRAALSLRPAEAQLHFNLAHTLRLRGQLAEAEAHYRDSIATRPGWGQAHFFLGVTLFGLGRHSEAEAAYRVALAINPDYPEALNNLAATLRAQDRLAEAETALRRALALKPDHTAALINLGTVLQRLGRPEEAIATLREALRINPQSAEARLNLGNVYMLLDRGKEAVASYEQAIKLHAGYGVAYNALARLYLSSDLPAAIRYYREAMQHDPANARGHFSGLVFALNYSPTVSQAEIFAEHKRCGELYGPPSAPVSAFSNAKDPERRLRLGYVSPDLRSHSVAFFIEPLLAAHDPGQVEVFCYSEAPPHAHDAVTARLKAVVPHWVDTRTLSDAALAARIREDGIDVLVDLAGHTVGHRLGVFAARAAPVQVSYLGYPNTTGLAAMDYRITDAWADPPGQERFYTEELVRLPHGFLCYQPPADAPPAGPPPVASAGHFTFGSFNALPKVNERVVACWARILKALPSARLLLKSKALRDPAVQEHFAERFARAGIGRERLELLGWLARPEEHLALYSRVDLALDPFPYNGITTTCEALWMGVPVLTLAGDRHAARVGVSLLSRLALEPFIARDEADYERIALDLAGDPARLAGWRAQLRPRMRDSTLCDGGRFAREFEQALRGMWRAWCWDDRVR